MVLQELFSCACSLAMTTEEVTKAWRILQTESGQHHSLRRLSPAPTYTNSRLNLLVRYPVLSQHVDGGALGYTAQVTYLHRQNHMYHHSHHHEYYHRQHTDTHAHTQTHTPLHEGSCLPRRRSMTKGRGSGSGSRTRKKCSWPPPSLKSSPTGQSRYLQC